MMRLKLYLAFAICFGIPTVITPGLAIAESYIVFVSEFHPWHTAALLMYENESRWIGFRSRDHEFNGPGKIDDSVRQEMIEEYVQFRVDPVVLRRAEDHKSIKIRRIRGA